MHPSIDRTALRRMRQMQAWPPAVRRAERFVRRALGISALAGACFALGLSSAPKAAVTAEDVDASASFEVVWKHGVRIGASVRAKSFTFGEGKQAVHVECPLSVPERSAPAGEDGGPAPGR